MANKMIFGVIALLMGFSAAWLYDNDELAVITELEDAPLEEVDWEDLFDDSSEIGARSSGKDVLAKLENQCKCEGLKCSCCDTPKIAGISFDACVNMTMYPEEKIIEIGAGLGGNNIYQNISVGKLERVCDRLPGFLKKVKICMYNTWKGADDDQSMSTCSSFDVQYGETIVATIKFHCLELKDGKISFAIPEGSNDKKAIMSFKMKNPVKSLISIVKNKIKGEKKE